jgi:hypothetical protein
MEEELEGEEVVGVETGAGEGRGEAGRIITHTQVSVMSVYFALKTYLWPLVFQKCHLPLTLCTNLPANQEVVRETHYSSYLGQFVTPPLHLHTYHFLLSFCPFTSLRPL